MGASILKMGYLLSSYQLSDFIICKELWEWELEIWDTLIVFFPYNSNLGAPSSF